MTVLRYRLAAKAEPVRRARGSKNAIVMQGDGDGGLDQQRRFPPRRDEPA
jgi:hypothetical protein